MAALVQTEAAYDGYLGRQREEVERMKKLEGTSLAEDFDYEAVKGLSAEAREKLDEAYRELKKYEVVQETRDLRQAREEARQEQIEFDEMGLQAYRRKHG